MGLGKRQRRTNRRPQSGSGDGAGDGAENIAGHGDDSRPRRSRVGATAVVVLLAAILFAAVGGAALGLGGRHHAAPKTVVSLTSAKVSRCTLTVSDTATGQLTYGAATALPLQATGLITWLPKPGTLVEQGQPLVRVNDRPVILLYGQLPQYRALHPATVTTTITPPTSTPTPTKSAQDSPSKSNSKSDTPPKSTSKPDSASTSDSKPDSKLTSGSKSAVSTDAAVATAGTVHKKVGPSMHGTDVKQLKTALDRLGYGNFSDNDVYGRGTVRAVKAWQHDLGEKRTGVVALGDIFYAAGPIRVKPAADVTTGQPMSPTALQRTGRPKLITAAVPATATWATVGAKVDIVLGQGATVAGVVASSRVASGSSSADGGKVLALVVHVADQAALAKAGAVVTLNHVNARRSKVLCVPAAALVALAEGGFGLQTAASSPAAYVAVRTGLFAQGKVEVSGAGVTAGLPVYLSVGK